MADIIQLRRDTAAQWTSINPTLAQGEIGLETDTQKIKVGDGSTAWTSLAYWFGGTTIIWGSITGTLSDQTDLQNELDDKEDAFTKNTAFNKDFGSASGTVCEGDDSRLSDDRDPTAHASDHQDGGVDEIGVGGLSGVLADDQNPVAHAIDGVKHTGNLDHADLIAVGVNDHHDQLHAASHASGGGDAVKLDDLASPDDNTDLDASISAHGLFPKLSNDAEEFLNGVGNWVEIAETDLAAALATRSSTYSLPTTWGTIAFNTTQVENDVTVINHDPVTNNSRITVSETGLYLVGYAVPDIEFAATSASTETHAESRVRKNGMTTIPGSEIGNGNYYSSSGLDSENVSLNHSFIVELTAGDYIEVQAQCVALDSVAGFTATAEAGASFWAMRMKGRKGATGATGSGSDINVKDDGVLVTGAPFDALNFVNSYVVEGVSGTADITPVMGANFQQAESDSQSSTTSTTWQQKVSITTPSLPVGTYRIGWYFEWTTEEGNVKYEYRVQVDGVDIAMVVPVGAKDFGDGAWFSSSGIKHTSLAAAVHTIDIDYRTNDNKVTYIRRARLEIWRTS